MAGSHGKKAKKSNTSRKPTTAKTPKRGLATQKPVTQSLIRTRGQKSPEEIEADKARCKLFIYLLEVAFSNDSPDALEPRSPPKAGKTVPKPRKRVKPTAADDDRESTVSLSLTKIV